MRLYLRVDCVPKQAVGKTEKYTIHIMFAPFHRPMLQFGAPLQKHIFAGMLRKSFP